MQTGGEAKKCGWAAPLLLVSALLLLPVIVALTYTGDRALFNFFAADAMYYMGIANNFMKSGVPSMDGISATNGYHPLWGFTLMGLFKGFSVAHHSQLSLVFWLSALLVLAAYVMVSKTFVDVLGTRVGLISTLTLFPGAYSLLIEPRRHFFGEPGMTYGLSPYSAINGMETSLSLALWAFFFMAFITNACRLSRERALFDVRSLFPNAVRISLGLIMLARLDDCFLAGAVAFFILSQNGMNTREKWQAAFYVLWPTAAMLVAYISFNLLTVGVPLPVSAASKMGAYTMDNLLYLFAAFSGSGGDWWWLRAVRVYPIFITLLAGVFVLRWCWKYRHANALLPHTLWKAIAGLFGMYLILKALFLYLCAPMINQGYWYYFAMIGVINVMCAMIIGFAIKDDEHKAKVVLLLCITVLAFRVPNDVSFMSREHVSNNYIPAYLGEDDDRNYADMAFYLWSNSGSIRKFLNQSAPKAKLLDTFDGMFSYLLDMPAESITGLASSPASIAERKAQGLWPSVIQRGYTIVPDYGYIHPAWDDSVVRVAETLKVSDVTFLRAELIKPQDAKRKK